MTMTRIAIIVGSTRPGRRGADVARWVSDHAVQRSDAHFELVDLADHELPHLNEPVAAAMSSDYTQAATRVWAERIAEFDGFVFVTPEYNHSFPGVLKNALDHLYVEWHDKAAAIVGYGIDGGVRAVEQLRLVLAELRVATVRDQVAISLFDDIDEDQRLAPRPHQIDRLSAALDDLIRWTRAMESLRTQRTASSGGVGRPSVALGGEVATARSVEGGGCRVS